MTTDAEHQPPGTDLLVDDAMASTDVPQINEKEEEQDEIDPFQCPICWDLLYKPVVLPCGHTFCFWCTHLSMNPLKQSQCPLCCQPYLHFPAVCRLLHSLVVRAAPLAHVNRRVLEIHEMEMGKETFSPSIQLPCLNNEDVSSANQASDSNCKLRPEDFSCICCKEFLYRPVVLNCGEVICEACLQKLGGSVDSCPSCNSLQPVCSFKHCLVFQNYLEHLFPEISKKREPAVLVEVAASETVSEELGTSDNDEIHLGVGCDGCGMCPIIGERYKCADCPESIGFDMCKRCYERGGVAGGRFNQQRTSSHRLERQSSFYHFVYRTVVVLDSDNDDSIVLPEGSENGELLRAYDEVLPDNDEPDNDEHNE